MPTYMGPRLTPGIQRLMIINVVTHVIFLIMLRTGLAPVAEALLLTPQETLAGGQLWQPLTYMFIHSPDGPGHLLMNMLMLFFFGPQVEQTVGTRKLYTLYVLSGLGGAAATLLLSGLGVMLGIGWLASGWTAATLGASGAVYGVLFCWGALRWHSSANFFLIGEIPVKYVIYFLVALQVLSMLSFAQGTSYSAHLGGMAAGFLLGRVGIPSVPWLKTPDIQKMRDQAKQRQDKKRRSRFEVIEGGAENTSDKDDTAGRPIWLHRPNDDDDDPVIH